METLEAGDVFEVALQIEKQGEKFYRYAVNLTDDPKMKDVFRFAADEEAKHRKIFEAMATKSCLPTKCPAASCTAARSSSRQK